METISIGVREFALPSPLAGSISSASGYGPMPVQRIDVHNYFLNKRKKQIPGYELETRLSQIFEKDGYEIKISGRVDGLISGQGGNHGAAVIEEVKTDFDIRSLEETLLANPEHPYRLQLLTYGYFWKLKEAKTFDLRFVLVSIKDNHSKVVPVPFDSAYYEEWFERRLTQVVEDYKRFQENRERRMSISKGIQFPYKTKRTGQEELMRKAGETVDSGGQALIQAPTGLGKTMGVLFPALQSTLAAGNQVIYVTAKNSQHEAVVEAALEINKQSPADNLKTLVLTAKAKICMKDEVNCNPGYCEYARDYYTKVAEHKLKDKVARAPVMEKADFVEVAKSYEVCPFELSLDCVDRADIVLGDYNYVFSPRNIMGRFVPIYQQKARKKIKPTLLIDEAHNLPDRAKSYYSSSLCEEDLCDIKARVIKHLPNYSIEGQALIEELLWLMRDHAGGGRYSAREGRFNESKFEVLNSKINEFVKSYLASTLVLQENDPLLALNSLVSDFTDCLKGSGEGFAHIIQPEKGGLLKIVCLDASKKLSECYSKVDATVAFSATLKPFDYFASVLGLDSQEHLSKTELDSPFPAQNRKLLIIPQVSTKYRDRPRNYPKIAEAIKRITAIREGNYVVFFPSYNFMEEMVAQTTLGHFQIISQKRNMSREDIQEYLDKLKQDKPTVLFAVQGGVFSEGIDYRGKMLIGAIIVGPALPRYDLEAELLQKYYDRKNGCGYKYTYVYPAMTKVIQSAGRVIRSEEDLGLMVLMDKRFILEEYREVMPQFWLEPTMEKLISSSIVADITNFWQSRKSSSKLPAWAEKIQASAALKARNSQMEKR